MQRDRAGNFLSKAKNLGTLTSTLSTSQDFVGKSDLDDLYKLSLSDRSSFNLQVSNLGKGAKIGIEIFTLKGAKSKVLKAIGKVAFSQLKGKDLSKNLRFVNKSTVSKGGKSLGLSLEAGEYYFRVVSRRGNTKYKIDTSATANPGSNEPVVPVQLSRKWIQQFGTNRNDYGYGVAVVENNLYLSGSTEGSLDGINAGDRDSYAALYTTEGTLQWQRQFGSLGLDVAADIAADSSGNYYVGGIDVTPPSAQSIFPDPNGYTSKYPSTGIREWTKPLRLTGVEAITGVTIDSVGNVYVSGLAKGFPGSVSSVAYVAKYNNSGQEIWSKEWSGTGSSSATGVAIDKEGNVYIAGITNATLGTDFTNPFSGGDAFVAKYSASGTKLWDKTIATPAKDTARGIAVDGSGNVYITGDTSGTISGQTSAGGTDGFVAKYSTAGTQQWVKQFGTSGLDESQGIAVTDAGAVFLTGETTGGIFGNTNAGGSDAWIGVFNGDGKLAGSTQIGTAQEDEAYGITVAGSSVYVVGTNQGAIASGTNQGQFDAWVTRYDIT
ncbi:MAG: hypothetical protein HC772_03500 [Leptolyngbyaceae cyanobacterium CRU_2_3]|nr:hypothetical protein [Leptolyngbyaceae cyanobacterium CRU_2_3]